MRARFWVAALTVALAGCAGSISREAPSTSPPIEVKIIALNDFHGNLEPPRIAIDAPGDGDSVVKVPAGGVAYLASAVGRLRAINPNNIVVSAGDMIGASPLISALFLDEPTIAAMNLIRVDLNALGNHEFDKGRAELLRMKNGGCEKFTNRDPCQVDRAFPGASFEFLSANVLTEDGGTFVPAYTLRRFGSGDEEVKIAFIGMTLKETPTVVTPAGVAGLRFADEAESANALIPTLREAGADAIVLVIHQGGKTEAGFNDKSCEGLEGDLLPILDRLDPAVDLVVSGHTHRAYICDYGKVNPARPFLLTSAGQYGTLLTDITLSFDRGTSRLIGKRADNLIVQSVGHRGFEGEVPVTPLYPAYSADPEVAALVRTYAEAATRVAGRVVGRMTGPALRQQLATRENVLGDLIADAQLAATRDAKAGGARIAFMNTGGVRGDLIPGLNGEVTYGQLFAVQPFGNTLVVKSFTGRQIRAVLEQQFNSGANTVESPRVLLPSSGLRYAYDLSRPPGERILDLRLDGAPIRDDEVYRVTISNFLAGGGDNFTAFREGTDPVGGPQDIDALEAYIAGAGTVTPPVADRIADATPK